MNPTTRKHVINDLRFGWKDWAIAKRYPVTQAEVRALRTELQRAEKFRQWRQYMAASGLIAHTEVDRARTPTF